MKGIDQQIHLLIITHEDIGWGEILRHFPKKEHRNVGRAIKRLVENKDIEHDKIRGKGKWKRYFVKEENTKNNLLLEAVNGNKKKWKYVRVPITQRKLSKGISESMQLYRKEELKEWKKNQKNKIKYLVCSLSYSINDLLFKVDFTINLGNKIRNVREF